MARVMAETGEMTLERRRRGRPQGDAYGTLLRTVIGQQLSAKAAFTIHGRVLELYGGAHPRPKSSSRPPRRTCAAAACPGARWSTCAASPSTSRTGACELERLDQLSDEEVIEEIVAVRGFGEWSAQMFLMFFLERPDVLPTGDLGIRKAVQIHYGLDELPEPDELTRIAEPWRPQRSLACIYLWESLPNAPQ